MVRLTFTVGITIGILVGILTVIVYQMRSIQSSVAYHVSSSGSNNDYLMVKDSAIYKGFESTLNFVKNTTIGMYNTDSYVNYTSKQFNPPSLTVSLSVQPTAAPTALKSSNISATTTSTAVEKVTNTKKETSGFLSPNTDSTINTLNNKSNAGTSVASSSSSSSSCPYSIKVYVYELPATLKSVHLAEEARTNKSLHICQKCILEQFAVEYIVYDYFHQFCGRTNDPNEADFFYLPIIRDAEYRTQMAIGGQRSRSPSLTEESLIDLLEKNDDSKWLQVFNITSMYWKKHNGADHILVMPAPVTNFRHEGSMRGFFHYMIHLYPPIFLALEYSASFVKEYPICSQQKNILVPYPTTDPDLYNGKLHKDIVQRNYLIYYQGGLHGDCVEVRKALKFLIQNSTTLTNIIPPMKILKSATEREHGFRMATFCPIPIGDSPSSKRMYDVLNFGCIPVILSDDLVYAYTKSVGGPLDLSLFAIQLPQAVIQFPAAVMLARYKDKKEQFGKLPSGALLYDILQAAVTAGLDYQNNSYVNPLVQILQQVQQLYSFDVETLRAGVESVSPTFRYYKYRKNLIEIPTSLHAYPDGGSMDAVVAMLTEKKSVGIDKIRDSCQSERSRKDHVYINRYPCDYEKNGGRRLTSSISSTAYEDVSMIDGYELHKYENMSFAQSLSNRINGLDPFY